MQESQVKNELPLFNLAPLESFSLKYYQNIQNEKLVQLITTFAVIHNDFKDMLWFKEFLNDHINNELKQQSHNIITAKRGQLYGMYNHCIRIICACAWEFIQTIEDNIEVISSPDFDTLVSTIDRPEYRAWKDIVKSITNQTGLYKTLREIRQNATYHYNQIKFATIGLDHYIKKMNDKGYISFGINPEQTRFYFADAAVQYYHQYITEKYNSKFNNEISQFIKKTLVCLHGIITIFFKQQVQTSKV